LKRSKVADSVSLSKIGSEDWGHIAQASGLKVESVQLPTCSTLSTGSSFLEAFSWEDKYEGSQSARCGWRDAPDVHIFLVTGRHVGLAKSSKFGPSDVLRHC
jgi:hypothetical protein